MLHQAYTAHQIVPDASGALIFERLVRRSAEDEVEVLAPGGAGVLGSLPSARDPVRFDRRDEALVEVRILAPRVHRPSPKFIRNTRHTPRSSWYRTVSCSCASLRPMTQSHVECQAER